MLFFGVVAEGTEQFSALIQVDNYEEPNLPERLKQVLDDCTVEKHWFI